MENKERDHSLDMISFLKYGVYLTQGYYVYANHRGVKRS